MSKERVAVVTDSGCSRTQEEEQVKELGVVILPLEIKFFQKGEWVICSDKDISPQEFYTRMRAEKQLPQTSGSVLGPAIENYERLSRETNSIISIHLTSRHSVAYQSACNAANYVMDGKPGLAIEIIDSRSLSLGTWFLAEMAAQMAGQGASLKEIQQETLATVPKIDLWATLSTLENAIKGGRLPFLVGYLGNVFKLKPILRLIDGEFKDVGKIRTTFKARQELVKRVEGENAEIIKMAVIHTNDPQAAQQVQQELARFYHQQISIYEAGPVLGVHGGEGAVGVVFQKA